VGWAVSACHDSWRVRPTPHRVVLVGIDGASWKVIGPMLERGELPVFARLVSEGAHMPRFGTIGTTLSPLVWTSVATGRIPEDHGIQGFTRRLVSGEVIPATSDSRRVPAIWNVAPRHGRTVGVISWWASWPAEAVAGYVITDHANPAISGWMLADGRFWTADPSTLRRDLDCYPGWLAPSLAAHWLDLEEFPYDEMQRRARFSEEQLELVRAAPFFRRGRYSWLKSFYAVDQPHFTLALRLARERRTDLLMLYLRGADPVQHMAWDLVETARYPIRPKHLERDRGIVEAVYRYLDSFLGEIMAVMDEPTTLIVASDHGMDVSTRALRGQRGRPGEHYPNTEGVLFIHGPDVKPAHVIEGADPLDLMPTMAWLVGIPVAADLPGNVLLDVFQDDFRAGQPLEAVASYGHRATRPGHRSPADAGMLEQLRALGYVE